jgi:hypothetical protein
MTVSSLCGLKPHVDPLPASDLTETGDVESTCRGEQKQRVSLTRAAYQDAGDDPLSAVEKHVDRYF